MRWIKIFHYWGFTVSISAEGDIAIGTTSSTSRLTVLKDFSAIDNTSVGELKMTDAGIDNAIHFLYKNTGGGQSNINFIDAKANGKSIFTLNGLGNAFLNGNMAIGTLDSKGYKLAVAGSMIAESVKIKLQSAWPDYIFNKDYKILSIDDIEAYIKTNHHLPEIPSASDVEKTGLDLGVINTKLLQKIEELTLYIIDLRKGNLELKENITKQQLLNDELCSEIAKIKKILNY